MNILTLELKKFIRGKLLPVCFCIIIAIVSSVFYKNYLDFQQVDADKKQELFSIKAELEGILYPYKKKSLYANDPIKMQLLKEAFEISEKTLSLRYKNDEKAFMENAVKMYEKVIEVKDAQIQFSYSKSYAEYEKTRLKEILKANANFYYEKAPLDSAVLFYKNIKISLALTFLVTIFYFLTTTYLDFKNHSGFLFTLPIKKSNFILGKAITSILINIFLIATQFTTNIAFGKIWKWQNNLKYPVFNEIKNTFTPLKNVLLTYISIEILISIATITILTLIYKMKYKQKN